MEVTLDLLKKMEANDLTISHLIQYAEHVQANEQTATIEIDKAMEFFEANNDKDIVEFVNKKNRKMNKEKFEPVKIYSDNRAIKDEIRDLEKLIEKINEYSRKLELEGIQPAKKHVQGIIDHGLKYVTQLIADAARADIKKLEVKSTIVQRNMKMGAVETANSFQPLINDIKNSMERLDLSVDDLQFTKGKAILNDAIKEQIKDKNSVWLTNPYEADLWNELSHFAEAMNRMNRYLRDNGFPEIFRNMERINELIEIKGESGNSDLIPKNGKATGNPFFVEFARYSKRKPVEV